MAGAVQDMRRGVVMGTSFGKGSVQTILPMIDQGAETDHRAVFHARQTLDPEQRHRARYSGPTRHPEC